MLMMFQARGVWTVPSSVSCSFRKNLKALMLITMIRYSVLIPVVPRLYWLMVTQFVGNGYETASL